MRSKVILLLAGLAVTLTSAAVDLNVVPCERSNSHLCEAEDFCIGLKHVCDGKEDCGDGSDERECPFKCVGENQFKCDTVDECISVFWKCDEDFDCSDRSDEKDCNPFPKTKKCPDGENQCKVGLCLPEEWFCDGQNDCSDGSDEEEALCSMARSAGGGTKDKACDEFTCKDGTCIPNRWRCDDKDDCPDGSDEGGICEAFEDPTSCDAASGWFLCADNATCINASLVCDGLPHCHDKSDEADFCGKKECENAKCPQGCLPTSGGPKCFCEKGYGISEKGVCEDVDECQEYGKCSQTCENTKGSYECSCLNGYHMNEVTKECEVFNVPPILLFSTRTEIRGISFDPDMKRTFRVNLHTTQLQEAIGLAFDGVNNRVYWTAVNDGKEAIMSSGLDGKELETFKDMKLVMPEDIAFDNLARNIYFTESDMKMIGVCSVKKKHCIVLLKEEVDKPRGIAVYPEKGILFYSDWGDKPKIQRVGMDGTEKRDIITKDIMWPNGITVDKVTERIFWADAGKNSLFSAKLDGSDRRVVLDHIEHPFSVAVFEDKLYWSDWQSREIQTCNKFTGKNLTAIVKEPRIAPMGITISHPILDLPSQWNPCARSFCSHLCLLTPKGGSVCRCPRKLELGPDDLSCVERAAPTTTSTSTSTTTTTSLPPTVSSTTTSTTTTTEVTEDQYDLIQINGRLYKKKDVHVKETTSTSSTTSTEAPEVKSQPISSSSFDTKGFIIGIIVLILVIMIIGQCIYCCISRRRQGKSDFSMHFRNIGLGATGGATGMTTPRHQLPSSSEELKDVSVDRPESRNGNTYSSFQNPVYSGGASALTHSSDTDLFHTKKPNWQSSLDLDSSSSNGGDLKRSSTNPHLAADNRSSTLDSRKSGESYLTTPSQSRDNLDEFDSISFGGDYSDKAQLIP